MHIIISLFLFLCHVLLTFYLAFAYGWVGILAAHWWVYIIVGVESQRLYKQKRTEGWLTTEEKQQEILKELAKKKKL